MKRTTRFSAPKTSFFIIALVLLALSGNVYPSRSQAQKNPDNSDPIEVGMVTLLGSPLKYDGKFIRTIGFMCLELEGNALYLHEEDYRYRNTKNSVELHLSKAQEGQFKSISLKYVLIEGRVSASQWDLDTGVYSGAIGNITRLELWRPRGDIPAPPQEPASYCSR
jgi:hypothetical protein